jgi:peroxiredoxin Q/BCP
MTNRSLKTGDKMPDFELLDQDGRTVRSSDLTGRGPVVVFFYPHDETPGCTVEACAFRDAFEDFKDIGASVIGISSDSAESHRKFADHHRLPFTLLSDPKSEAREAFGVPNSMGVFLGRVTYIFDGNGVLRYVFNSQTRVKQHVTKSLEIIKKIGSKI